MLSDLVKQEIRSRVDRDHPEAVAVEALHIVRNHYGWISDEMLREVAGLLDVDPAELDGAATFYNHLYRKPVGRHVILVCDSVSCWIMGYESLVAHLTRRLGIGMGETTADGRFTLLPIQCLGSCHTAPALMIDADLHEELDEQKLDAILAQYP
ncbi:MAG: NADH-quinone oxidoreductase subunit NuoE [Desulfomonile tiedjei]|nr:NADH-quinone oxidoreductase subunit NuoE [Desulfomonile tiedjei]